MSVLDSAGSGTDAVILLAATAVDLAPTDPQRARALVLEVQRRAGGDAEPKSMVERALGLIAMAGGDAATAESHLRCAVQVAEAAGLDERAAEARMSMAFVLFMTGATAGALQALDRAAPALRGLAAARLVMTRALILARLGRLDEALDGYHEAVTVFRRAGDRVWEAKTLGNRGWLYGYRGEWHAAEADLRRAEALYLERGNDVAAAGMHHNLGFVAAMRGDVPAALTRYDEADERYREAGRYRGQLLLDRAEVLLSVRLVTEGRRDAEQALRETTRNRIAADQAEARLMLARAALFAHDLVTARAAAEQACRAFIRQKRTAWAALARYIGLRAAWEEKADPAATLRAARRATRALSSAGWAIAEFDTRLITARLALDLGQAALARRELAAAARARRTGPADLRARAWLAEALRRLGDGDRRGAKAALRAGLAVLDRFQATLGATELRASVAGHAAELAQLGLRLAFEAGQPADMLVWSERWRAGALRLRPARPPDDPLLAEELAQLRRLTVQLDEAALEGRDTTRLLRQQAALEQKVRNRALHARGGRAPRPVIDAATLREQLGARVLVSYIGLGGRLHAVVVTGHRTLLRQLSSTAEAEAELEACRFALRRLARSRGPERSLAAAEQAAVGSAERLDALLLAPLGPAVKDRELVIVPTGALHALPWSLLPSVAGRPLTVAPSASLWYRADCAEPPPGTPPVLVAGPRLAHSGPEIEALGRSYPDALCFPVGQASSAAVLAALNGASVAHIAAHGAFRSDNPLFSCLHLDDGPLTVYDLERLDRAPALVVLSACESGLSDVRPGDELMGLTSALFALGTRTLIASVISVPDDATMSLMLSFHSCLRAGMPPAAALARAQSDLPSAGYPQTAAAGFVCFGAG